MFGEQGWEGVGEGEQRQAVCQQGVSLLTENELEVWASHLPASQLTLRGQEVSLVVPVKKKCFALLG